MYQEVLHKSQGADEYPTYNKKKKGLFDWSHIM